MFGFGRIVGQGRLSPVAWLAEKRNAVQQRVRSNRPDVTRQGSTRPALKVPEKVQADRERQWFSGKIHRCHRWAPRSIRG